MDGALYGSMHPVGETAAQEPSAPEPRVISSLAGVNLAQMYDSMYEGLN